MRTTHAWTAVLVLCTSLAAAAAEADGAAPAESAQVGGATLRLNGAGLSQRFAFKLYAIGLYLREPKTTVQAVLDSEGPRRIAIVMLRDIGSRDFSQAIEASLAARDGSARPPGSDAVIEVGLAIAAQPEGLRRGDRLTIDWLPGVGTVVELNRRPIARPAGDRSVYNALLNVWLGGKPVDASLKAKLLGASPA